MFHLVFYNYCDNFKYQSLGFRIDVVFTNGQFILTIPFRYYYFAFLLMPHFVFIFITNELKLLLLTKTHT
jgi:hypothetical protein